jgi:hypothetical protein
MSCNHITKVLEWGFSENHDFTVALWGCVLCDVTSDKPFKDEDDIEIDHTACGPDCFGCKAKGLQLNAGDATRDISKKAWNSRLNGYANAKAQGIQPGGTTPEKVRAAYEASETLNRPYNAEKMPAAHKVNDKVAEVMKEVGI